MTLTLGALNAMPPAAAAEVLSDCCAAPRWVEAMVTRRPFGSFAELRAAADEVWRRLGPDDYRAAFAHHPRIGESQSEHAQGARGRSWSAAEQAGVGAGASAAAAAVGEALAAINRAYEAKFGHIYIVRAAGRSAEELVRIAEARLANTPAHELTVAAGELREICQLRLAKLLTHDEGVTA